MAAQLFGGSPTGGTPLFNVPISLSATGDIVVLQGVGRAIRVHQITLVASGGANTVTLRSGTTALTGAIDLAADGQYVSPDSPQGLAQTSYDEALNLLMTAATLVAGSAKVSIIDANLQALKLQA
jgi:hypothetical protein